MVGPREIWHATRRVALVDADPANDTQGRGRGGFRRDASPFFRIFNPTVQGTKFDPDGSYSYIYPHRLVDHGIARRGARYGRFRWSPYSGAEPIRVSKRLHSMCLFWLGLDCTIPL
jgi:hypothetical protein